MISERLSGFDSISDVQVSILERALIEFISSRKPGGIQEG
jgi:hypothetical protein